jgi:hypothetical protein
MRPHSPFLRLATGVVPNTTGLDARLAAVAQCAGALLALLVRLPRYMTARQARLFSDLYYPLRYIAGVTPAQERSGVAPRLCALGVRVCRRTPWHTLYGARRDAPFELVERFRAALRAYLDDASRRGVHTQWCI